MPKMQQASTCKVQTIFTGKILFPNHQKKKKLGDKEMA
jgi:hypothetical protein